MSESTAVRSSGAEAGAEAGTDAGDLARAALLLPPRTSARRVEEVRGTLADFLATAPEDLAPWARHQAQSVGVHLQPGTGWTRRRRRTVRRVAIIVLAHVVGLGLFGSACQGSDDAALAAPTVQTVCAS